MICGDKVDESISLESLTWSLKEFTLSNFVDKFPLPQIVKVQEGYYGPDEDSCLGAHQILFLHAIKHTEKVQASDKRKRDLHIPLNCSQKVELRPSNLKDVYGSVAEISKAIKTFPKYVRVTQGYYMESENVCINPGDKLKLERIVSGEKDDYLVAENQDRMGFPIRLPLSANVGFQPLTDDREFYLKEAIDANSIPFLFQFIEPPKMNSTGEPAVFNNALGVLRAEKTYQDNTVICTTKEGSIRTVVTCPKDLEITVAAANGALIGDKDYVSVCRFFHDGVSLKKIESLEAYNVFASRNTIREYIYDTPKPRKHKEPIPNPEPVPASKETKEPILHTVSGIGEKNTDLQPDDDDDDYEECHDYTYIDDSEIFKNTNRDNKFDYESFAKSFDEFEEEGNENDAALAENQSKDSYETNDKPLKEDMYLPMLNESSDTSYVFSHMPMESAAEENSQVENIKDGILYLEKPKPPPVFPKPVARNYQTASSAQSVAAQEEKPEATTNPAVTTPTVTNSEKEPSPANLGVGSVSSAVALAGLTIEDVSKFLEQHRLTEFVEKFEYNQIDGEMLVCLDQETMEALGLNAFQRKKLLKLIQGWRPNKN